MAKVVMNKVIGYPRYVDGAALRNLFYATYDSWAKAGLVEDGVWPPGARMDDWLRYHLARLLGYKDYYEMIWADASEYEAAIQAMAGEYGYAIYRMLLVQRGMT